MQCIDLASFLGAVAATFPKFLSVFLAKDAETAQIALDGARGSLFRFVGADYPGDHEGYPDDSDVGGGGRVGFGERPS